MADSNAERQRRKRAKPGFKDRTAAERQRRYQAKRRKSTAQCSLCGGWLHPGSISERFGFHQRCDRARYQRMYRALKKSQE